LAEEIWNRNDSFWVTIKRTLKSLSQSPPITKEVEEVVPTAYILLNTEIGAENQVLRALKKIEGVAEAHSLWGVYNIIASVEADTVEKLKSVITNHIGKIGKINSKQTMIISEQPQITLRGQVFFEPTPITQ
jgi:DNA-binding Lrp family transcriptional regulator